MRPIRGLLFLIAIFCTFVSSAQWTTSGNDISNSNTGNVGIGTPSPQFKLDLNGSMRTTGTIGVNTTLTGGLLNIQMTEDGVTRPYGIYMKSPSSAGGSGTHQYGVYLDFLSSHNDVANLVGIYGDLAQNLGQNATGVSMRARTVYGSGIGVEGIGFHADPGGPGIAIGLRGQATTTSSSGTLGTTYAGYFTNDASAPSTNYGIYVNTSSYGTWGIYQAGGIKNYFSGNLGIGTSPAAQLHTTGTVRFAGLANGNTHSRVVVMDEAGSLFYRDASTLSGGTGSAVLNQTGVQPNSNFFISNEGTAAYLNLHHDDIKRWRFGTDGANLNIFSYALSTNIAAFDGEGELLINSADQGNYKLQVNGPISNYAGSTGNYYVRSHDNADEGVLFFRGIEGGIFPLAKSLRYSPNKGVRIRTNNGGGSGTMTAQYLSVQNSNTSQSTTDIVPSLITNYASHSAIGIESILYTNNQNYDAMSAGIFAVESASTIGSISEISALKASVNFNSTPSRSVPVYGVWSVVESPNSAAGSITAAVYAKATNTGNAPGYAIYAAGGNSYFSGKVGIGTATPHAEAKLAVNGHIYATKVKVTQNGWPDYVFEDDYRLAPLDEVEQFIKKNKHLSEIPSTKEIEKNGLDLGDNQALLLKKIEELTLYLIEMKKEMGSQSKRIVELESIIEALKSR